MRGFVRAVTYLVRRIWCIVRHPRALYSYDYRVDQWVCDECGAGHGA